MGFSILGFDEDSLAGVEQSPEKRLYAGVESGDEGRHHESPSQMLIMTSEDDVRDPTTSNEDAATPTRDVPSDGYHAHRASAGVANNSSTILGDLTLFRDFFVAAFSDYNVCIHTTSLSRLFPQHCISVTFTHILLIVLSSLTRSSRRLAVEARVSLMSNPVTTATYRERTTAFVRRNWSHRVPTRPPPTATTIRLTFVPRR
jgi:hypothetical protein